MESSMTRLMSLKSWPRLGVSEIVFKSFNGQNKFEFVHLQQQMRKSFSMWSFFVVMMMIVAACAEEDMSTCTSGSCTIDSRHVLSVAVENVMAENQDGNVSMYGFQGPILGGFRIITSLPADPVKMTCSNRDSQLPEVFLQPVQDWLHSFDVHSYVFPWTCTFYWKHAGDFNYISFDVWNHDGIYGFLLHCDLCVWSVRSDGFYILQDDEFFSNVGLEGVPNCWTSCECPSSSSR